MTRWDSTDLHADHSCVPTLREEYQGDRGDGRGLRVGSRVAIIQWSPCWFHCPEIRGCNRATNGTLDMKKS